MIIAKTKQNYDDASPEEEIYGKWEVFSYEESIDSDEEVGERLKEITEEFSDTDRYFCEIKENDLLIEDRYYNMLILYRIFKNEDEMQTFNNSYYGSSVFPKLK